MIRRTTTLLLLTTTLLAQTGQTPPRNRLQPTLPIQQGPTGGAQNPAAGQQPPRAYVDPDLANVTPIWQSLPSTRTFQGFPIFPGQLGGYGRYPGALADVMSQVPIGEMVVTSTAPAPPEHGWPQWLKNASRESLPYEPDVALLVRNVDRVWWKPSAEEVFVPLYFYDKLRSIREGSEIEVRQVGEFELLLHGGSRLIAQGVTELKIDELGEGAVAITLERLTNLRLEAFGRQHRITLPDGSRILMTPKERPKADAVPEVVSPLAGFLQAAAVTPFEPGLLVFERQDEPGWRSGRATIWNGGRLPVTWEHAFGSTTIVPGTRVTFFLAPPAAVGPAALTSDRVSMRAEGQTVRCEAQQAGQVSWSGARFVLSQGAIMHLDPMLGDPFATTTAPPTEGGTGQR